ncbi:MAG: hypothetical protein COZ06_33145 [Armatimonadetes bacterium CG_4_10_14_3_um_filter_66_18]|nr:hypothetical protein [Armatimonadota bacterium]OIP04339.1 MAG: hypothetical protein AUJ96_13070 [Armatimonadetes bacterium CG2_30_66_41]PIU95073.1 MAG: hypothetical protein COS65_04350 [Armatimonadetes bacterium CG06_land_8_20_14_3_00_66_21]PIY37314.1 MAG: hypothetical protein COZ06_33145 [Armatimonadetes bacterium CG_4_10_14_3_um_filter_66_18]PIZ51531.1 MAG: hypothetical protein COY42_00075 [Armatimonadetes bacterium CG_4_10_14_0_8_um_filter_66_14]PJB62660.1 MAG: hypothetical protein CO096
MNTLKGTALKEECTIEYSTFHTVLENIPYAVMLLLGAAILVLTLGSSATSWFAAAGFVLYGVAGSFWIILFLCPHCPSHGQRSCPCGYGVLSAKYRPKGDYSDFTRKFRRHIPVIAPLWFVPVVFAVVAMVRSFAPSMAVLLGIFVLDAYILLPWLSKGHGCKDCPQRSLCPWWAGKAAGSAATG